MYGQGIAKGLWVTFKHFINTYVDDIRYAGRKYLRQENFEVRQGLKATGAYTVQYPEEKIAQPERFRFVPFLVVEDPDHPERPGHDWCTSCGICAKVCPPQCIWIVRGEDPNTGRPVPEPEAFYIDIDICMNCGYCAEFCPFDAIKMDHDYELANYDRTSHNIHDKARLSKPFSYYLNLAPTTAYEEAVARGSWEHSDVQKAKKKESIPSVAPHPIHSVQDIFAEIKANAPAPKPQAFSPATAAAVEAGAPPAPSATQDAEQQSAEDAAKAERQRKREEALARKRAKEGGGD